MPTITQHRPESIEGDDAEVVAFETVEQLVAIPFVAHFRTVPGFHQFSLWLRPEIFDMPTQDAIPASVHLMAEYHTNSRWYVVGRIDGDPPVLPTWEPREDTWHA